MSKKDLIVGPKDNSSSTIHVNNSNPFPSSTPPSSASTNSSSQNNFKLFSRISAPRLIINYLLSLVSLMRLTVLTLFYHWKDFIFAPVASGWAVLSVWFYATFLVPWVLIFQLFLRDLVSRNQNESLLGPGNLTAVRYALESLVVTTKGGNTNPTNNVDGHNFNSSLSPIYPQIYTDSNALNIIGTKLFLALTLLMQNPNHLPSYIIERSKAWGLNVKILAGFPGCAIFHCEEKRIMILVTSMTFCDMQSRHASSGVVEKTDGRAFVFGRVWKAPYEELFINRNNGIFLDATSPGSSGISGTANMSTSFNNLTLYETILMAMDEIILLGWNHHSEVAANDPINFWLCGAGLSAALTTLLHARWLKVPADLPPILQWHGSYTFGGPSVGDYNFAADFESYSNTPLTFSASSPFWRINLRSDLVPYLYVTLPGAEGQGCFPATRENVHVGRLFVIDKNPSLVGRQSLYNDEVVGANNGGFTDTLQNIIHRLTIAANQIPIQSLQCYAESCLYLWQRTFLELFIKLPDRIVTASSGGLDGTLRIILPWFLFDSLQSTYYESITVQRSQFIKKRQ